uniref:Uncharacterized protein n=1 Tax=Mola mola TaxID=94237 RepID=A0A3Q4AGN2_MOLML
EVVRPQRLPGRQRRSPWEGQLYPDTVRYELTVEGKNHTIHLEKNRSAWFLLWKICYTETHYSQDGKRVTTSPNEDHCYYHGHIEGVKDSSVSVAICSGMSGFLRARQQVYLIEPVGHPEDGEHALYRQEHLKVSGRPRCGSSSNTSAPYDEDQGPQLAGFLRSRLRVGPQKFVELFVVADNAEYTRYGSKTKDRILGAVNHVDKLYRPLNIRVMLVGLEIWTIKDYIYVARNSDKTLDNFLLWRQANLLHREKHDTAQFITGIDFDGDTVGLANKFAMCTENSGGINQDHHDSPIGLASTIAHEMGHNFGLSHDAPDCVCGPSYSSENCVMADKTGNTAFPEFFSNCSMEQLAEFIERAQPTCLSKPSSSTQYIAVADRCGNAMLDPGEDCDCGTVEECSNPCCDALTCRLTQGSQCAHGQCCENCQAGSMCRKSASECDLPEYCTGVSEHCPEDSFELNGKPCYNQAQGYCYDGQCPTHKQHCWRLFGPGTRVGLDVCFDLNKLGEESANCGRSKFSYIRCTEQYVNTNTSLSYRVQNTECRTVVDDDRTRNINMVPKGTRCGPNKVCLDNRCVDLSVYGVKEECAKKCNNNGVSKLFLIHCYNCSELRDVRVRRKVHSAPDKLNPMFQEPSVKSRPLIGEPTLVESTATQACSPLVVAPSRAAPQVRTTATREDTAVLSKSCSTPSVLFSSFLHKTGSFMLINVCENCLFQRVSAKPPPPPVPPVKPRPT